MTAAQVIVTAAGVAVIAVLARYFFRTRAATAAVEQEGVQEVRVTVKGGYSPDAIRARTGVPLRIVFDRQEDGDCSSRVVFADLALSRYLPPFEQTTVEFTPTRPGTFGFACGMNMLHGSLEVEGDAVDDATTHGPADDGAEDQEGRDVEAEARRAEVARPCRHLRAGDRRTLGGRCCSG